VNPWLAKNLVYRPATWLRGEPVHSLLRQYEESQWWSSEEVARAQENKLCEILRYAGKHSPYYREHVARLGLVAERLDASDLQQFPVLTKTDLVERANDLHVKGLPGTYSWKTTGGSTGVPVRLRKSRFATAAEQAASWRSYR
jgi:phenylacetate-coenzyme A ligase PaaK-like adenylate-forming protein